MNELNQIAEQGTEEQTKTPKKARTQTFAISAEAKAGFTDLAQALNLSQEETMHHITRIAQQDLQRQGLGDNHKQTAQDVANLTKSINDLFLRILGDYQSVEDTITRRYDDRLQQQGEQIAQFDEVKQGLEAQVKDQQTKLDTLSEENTRLKAQLEQLKPTTEEERYKMAMEQMAKVNEDVAFLLENEANFCTFKQNKELITQIIDEERKRQEAQQPKIVQTQPQ